MSLQDAIARNRARHAKPSAGQFSIFDCLTHQRVSEETYATADEANHDYHMNAGHTCVGVVAPARQRGAARLMEPNAVGELHGHVHYERESCKSDPPCKPLSERMKAYTVNVLVVPPNHEIALGLATMHEEKRTIYGTSLADAKRRAGIE
jgi:hypothetical protein